MVLRLVHRNPYDGNKRHVARSPKKNEATTVLVTAHLECQSFNLLASKKKKILRNPQHLQTRKFKWAPSVQSSSRNRSSTASRRKRKKKHPFVLGGGHVLGIKKTSQIFHQPGWFLLKILGHQQPLYHSNLLKGISRVKEITSSCLGSYLPEVQDLAGLSSLEVPKFPPKKRYGYSSWWLVQPNPSENYEN